MFTKKSKKQTKQHTDTNPIEAIRNSGSATTTSSDALKGIGNSFWDQMLGVNSYSERPRNQTASGELSEGQELDLSKHKKAQKESPASYVEPAYDYRREIIHGEKRIQQENHQIIQMQIKEIIVELKKLTSASKELEIEFKEVAVAEVPVSPGKYHVNFFEWLLATIKIARMRVEDSANWLAMFSSKKKKRQYWGMFKKHGTTFGLSNERIVATQTG